MANLGYHLMCRLHDDRVIAPTAPERRLVARTVLTLCRHVPLLCFHLVDSHLHLEILATLARCMRVAQRIQSAIKQRLGLEVGFARARPKPIADQAHLFNLFDYILRQQSRHGLDWDPFFDASNLPDLLGLRPLGAYTARLVHERLPRVKRSYLLARLGVGDLEPARAPLTLLAEAALAAAGLNIFAGTAGRTARVAAVRVAGNSVSAAGLARRLGVNRHTITRMRQLPAAPDLVRAIALQLALRGEARDDPHKEGVFDGMPATR